MKEKVGGGDVVAVNGSCDDDMKEVGKVFPVVCPGKMYLVSQQVS